MKDPLHETIFKIKESLEALSGACLNGVESWDKYNQLVGRAQGLQESLDTINMVLQEDEEIDNEYRK